MLCAAAGIILLFTMLAGAMQPPDVFEFGIWNGSGSASVSIGYNYESFAELSAAYNNEIHSSDYTICGTDNSAVITLKEEYLKTFLNGIYSMGAAFAEEGMREYVILSLIIIVLKL